MIMHGEAIVDSMSIKDKFNQFGCCNISQMNMIAYIPSFLDTKSICRDDFLSSRNKKSKFGQNVFQLESLTRNKQLSNCVKLRRIKVI